MSDGLGLDKAGVKLNEQGRDHRRPLFPDIGPEHLCRRRCHRSHQSDARRHPRRACLCRHVFSAASRSRSITMTCRRRCSPSPELGTIGLTEAEARQRLARVDIYKSSFRPMKATLAARDSRSFFKLIVDGETDRVVGCHIAGPDAGEMIQTRRHRHQDARHQGRLRRGDGGPPDCRRRTRHHAYQGCELHTRRGRMIR